MNILRQWNLDIEDFFIIKTIKSKKVYKIKCKFDEYRTSKKIMIYDHY